MTQERWRRLEDLFPRALALEPAERASFVRQCCPDDPELRDECERLLGFDDQAERDRFLDPAWMTSHPGSRTSQQCHKQAVASWSSIPYQASRHAPGDRVGKYEVIRRLGHGAQGSALLARDPDLQTRVVLELYHAVDTPAGRDVLLSEGRALARARHPNVARCLGIERIDDLLVLVVENIPGRDLAAHWRETPGSYRAAAQVVEQVAAGLAGVHACGLVHRDIKPSNVVLGDDGTPRLVDFGLAVALGSDTGRIRSGSPAYMAPEQARGEWEHVDPRTDVFGLGAILYELLTGRPPYQAATSRSVLRQAEACRFPALRQLRPSIPRGLERICMRAMSAAPERRYASAAEFQQALGHWRRRRHRLAVAGGVLVLSLALLGAVSRGLRPSASPPKPAATNVARAGSLLPALPVVPLRIIQLGVEHLAKRSETEYDLRGNLGQASFQVKPGDDVRLRGELSAPAYAFLIAFRPDGVVEVCDPEDPAVPPTRTSQTQYPPRSKSGEVYRLEDGAGLQAFALVASKDPLPSFHEWQRRVGTPPWTPGLPGPAGVVRQHDGHWIISGSRDDRNGQRGKGKTIRGGSAITVLADWLRKIPGIEAVEVVAFPVPGSSPDDESVQGGILGGPNPKRSVPAR